MGDTKKIIKPNWVLRGIRPLVSCKGNALLECLRGKDPQKLKVFSFSKTLKRLFMEDRNKLITSALAHFGYKKKIKI